MPPAACVGVAMGARNHGVSDPAAHARRGPAPVRRVAHAMAGTVASGCRTQQIRRREAPRVCLSQRARLRLRSSGGSGPVRPENVARNRSCFALARQPVAVQEKWCPPRAAFDVDLAAVVRVITLGVTSTVSAITTTMLHLCSAPCKALRFAPPARTRGLRALTVPVRR